MDFDRFILSNIHVDTFTELSKQSYHYFFDYTNKCLIFFLVITENANLWEFSHFGGRVKFQTPRDLNIHGRVMYLPPNESWENSANF